MASRQKGKGSKRLRSWHRSYRSGGVYDRLLRDAERAFQRAEAEKADRKDSCSSTS